MASVERVMRISLTEDEARIIANIMMELDCASSGDVSEYYEILHAIMVQYCSKNASDTYGNFEVDIIDRPSKM